MGRKRAGRDIAIIGAGLRLPGAVSLDQFWAHLLAGRSLISEVSPRRWDKQQLQGNPAQGEKTASIKGGFLEDADCFDAEFFSISPREAAWMDPQQRFALELAWHAIEDAAYPASALAGSNTGVFMGVCHWDYAELLEKHLAQLDAYTPTGIAFSIIANRVSHFFDLRGPSVTNDTACAASLTSIHEAVRALQLGSCDLALAGGVNLIWSPNHFVAFSKNGMLSKEGSSKAFDARADGYVRGEGGAMLLLKPLDRALADGDPIHGVIRGVGINHGGRTNSLTVTNPMAQADLIVATVHEAEVAPDSISYIEAHGTGTPLGDPIEITGLKTAFARLYEESGRAPEPGSCAIGSVKTNIGHLEGAAGVAGLVKVLAALRHETLPGNVDFIELNPLVDLQGSPFRIQQAATPWPRQAGRPRRAGVSAFGFGGSNAHLLLEEAPLVKASSPFAGPCLIPLSARNPERLVPIVQHLLDFLRQSRTLPGAGLQLADLAWTLQVGREAMAARLLWRVDSLPALEVALEEYLAQGAASPSLMQPEAGADGLQVALARRWLAGATVPEADWRQLYGGQPPRRLHLPAYAFARLRYWMDTSLGDKDTGPLPHPLLHRNLSRLALQHYRSRFSGTEFFWAEHHVGPQQVLPGVVCLEMARAAWTLATGQEAGLAPCCIEQVVWRRPVRADGAPTQLDIRLTPQGAAQLGFAIESGPSPDGENVQGVIGPLAAENLAEPLDLNAWRADTETQAPASLYARLGATGMHHGPSFQCITGIYRGQGHVLVSLKLSRRLRPSLDAFALHPILMDGAIQAWMGLEAADRELPGAAVPFSCRQIEVFGPCEEQLWALVQPLGNQEGGLRRLQITLADREGRVRVRFHDLALRLVVPGEAEQRLLYSMPAWEARPLPVADLAPASRQTRVLWAGFSEAVVQQWQATSDLLLEALPLPAGDDGETALAWCEILRQRLVAAMTTPGRQQWLVALPAGVAGGASAALAALLRCVMAEQPRFSGAVLQFDPALSGAEVAGLLQAEARREDSYSEIAYDAAGLRRVSLPLPMQLPEPAGHTLDPDGVVWVTGGRGGLAQHFSRWLAAQGVRWVVLSSRGGAPGERQEGDCSIIERPCDVTDPAQVQATVAWIQTELGPLKGIIHAAGLLRDGYLLNKPAEDFPLVFAPKVQGLIYLDEATRAAPLDFFLVCSSIAATLGNPGQSDYAAANAWQEAWCRQRNQLQRQGERQGRALAIAWPLWEAGGMQVDEAGRAMLQRRFGSAPLPTAAAMNALESVLSRDLPDCVTVHYGREERIRQVLAQYGAAATRAAQPAQAMGGEQRTLAAPAAVEDLEGRTIAWLQDLLGELIQMAPEKILPRRRLEEYGLDSIVIVEMTQRMEEALGPLSKTLFFEYVDLAGVAGHLLEEQGAALAALFAGEQSAPSLASGEAATRSAPAAPAEASPLASGEEDAHDIAIVGLALHVAGADDQESFWQMLERGEHRFRRVPPERWDHETLVHPERDVLGKTVVQTGAFLDGIDRFDPRYFRISQAEAELMSPEVRLFLQTCVEAFEDAGYSRETLQRRYAGQVAVIMGSMTNDYHLYGFQNMLQRGALASGSYTGTVPNMVSYYYGFTGPSYFLDTMCSAAGTCVLEAVYMLRSGRVPMALAGGTSLLLHPQKLIATSQEHFTSKTAEVIRGYGLGADGTILGEGVGALVMKRRVDAERDGDHIYGLIKGGGLSNAGIRNGFTVPNPRQQAAAIQAALADSGVDPASISYIEGHGSGTALGDPIEIKALKEAYGPAMAGRPTCPIGTVKSNVAHLLGAAALPGIVKVLLQMQRGKLAPSLHAETLNPNIPFADTPFHVQRELAAWPRPLDAQGRELPRRAGVTTIGAGGINVHLILEEAPASGSGLAPRPPAGQGETVLLPLSAMNPERLQALVRRLLAYLEAHPEVDLRDLAWTLQVGRNELPCRLALLARDRAAVQEALSGFLEGRTVAGLRYVASILEKDVRVAPEQVAAALAGRQWEPLAEWWCAGVAVPWIDQPASGQRRLSLPAYPFEQVRCWYQSYPDAPSVLRPLGAGLKLHPFVGSNQSDRHGLRYRTDLHLGELLDYCYTRQRQPRLLPTAVLEMGLALLPIAGFAAPGQGLEMTGLEVGQAPDGAGQTALLAGLQPEEEGARLELALQQGDSPPVPFARARLGVLAAAPAARVVPDALRASALESLERARVYGQLAERQLEFRPYQEVLDSVWKLPEGAWLGALAHQPPQQDHHKRRVCLPARVLGGLWQLLALALPSGAGLEVARLAHLGVRGADAETAALILLRPAAAGAWDAQVLDAEGNELAVLQGLQLGSAEALQLSAPSRPLSVPAAVAAGPDRLTVAAPPGPETRLTEGLRALVARQLKFDPAQIDPRSPFYDLGFDSISLTRLAGEINAEYGSQLTPAIFYECEHIAALAGWLASRVAVPESGLASGAEAVSATTTGHPAEARPLPLAGTGEGGRRPVAVVGMALRLPGCETGEAFYRHLLAGADLVGPLPLDRYPPPYRARMEAAGFPLQGGFLADIDRFDAACFKTSPHEASRMDPQQRLLLETAWRAFEQAGYRPDELPGDCGVFVGVCGRDYASLLQEHGVTSDAHVATGNSLAMVANRLSWQFNLQGPSEAVDTACSSSLVALLRAVDAVGSGRASMALAAGVNLALAIEGFAGPWQAGMLSPSGRCRTFSRAADGYVRGEGVVVLVLKALADAERDGDDILGVVAGGAENHGGHAGALTAPNAKAQAALIQSAWAGLDPASIGYVEAHGTGTPLGDPVEVNGLRLAYAALAGESAGAAPPARIGLGSVKSNIGHLEAAAGLAGVAKVLLALRGGELPPTLHCTEINPYIELQDSPFYLVRERQPWPAPRDAAGRSLPRRAGISSFGFGGSNAHVVLQEYPHGAPPRRRQPLPPRPFADTRFWLPEGQSGSAPGALSAAPADTLLWVPVWHPQPLPALAGPRFQAHRVLPVGFPVALAAPGAGQTLQWLPCPVLSGNPAERYSALAASLLLQLQQTLSQQREGRLLFQLLLPTGAEGDLLSGLGALLDSAMAEHPRLCCQLLQLPLAWSPAQIQAVLLAEAGAGEHRRVRHGQAGREVRCWEELPAVTAGPSPWRCDGVYLISGGLGALGQQLAAHIAAQAPGATLVLAGTSPLDDVRRAALEKLRRLGVWVDYRRLDVADAAAVQSLVQSCRETYGGLHGLIHCAGIHRDRGLLRKTPEELRAVLAPKVQGTQALLEACRGLPLEVCLLFSSMAGAVGNAGQTDYAAANGFMGAMAGAAGAPCIAIDWPLWRDGGMQVDAAGEAAFFAQMGQRPLSSEQGLAALERGLASGRREVAVVGGDAQAIRRFFQTAPCLPTGQGSAAAQPGAVGFSPAPDLSRPVAQRLGELLGRIAGMPAERILADEPLEHYGIDSLMIKRLNQELGSHFGQLSKTLFFECRTLAEVTRHLLERHGSACRAWVGELAGEPARLLPAADPLLPAQAGRGGVAPIAIIGISGRYPQAENLTQFWESLAAGRECIEDIPAGRWSLEDFYEPDPDLAVASGRSYCRRGGFLTGFADFDPAFFRLSPREAAAMDPQERLFLMAAWAACEDAAYSRERLAAQHGGRVGVFVGVTKNGYGWYRPWQEANGARIRPSSSFASVANRVSFHLGLKGPSLPVDTMCSSSLTAIHEACQHLRQGECDMALAGGVNLYLHPDQYVELSAARMLSPDGHCRSFGAGGNGFVPGEGVGCLVLKPLDRALADGDRIHGLIRGSAVNHGGKTSGYTVPNPLAQGEVVRAALAQAGVEAASIGYVEAHGTGTELGDPIEFTGLCEAFGPLPAGHCALGSVKSGIGHLEAAAGVAGVTKVLLQMRHGQWAPSLHGDQLNPNIPWGEAPFRLQTRLAPWPSAAGQSRLAGVSSFGAGGANAHVVLESWPGTDEPVQDAGELGGSGEEAILLSARSPERLREAARQLLDFLAGAAAAGGAGSLPIAAVSRLVAATLSVAEDDLEPDEDLEAYGLDAVHRQSLRRSLEQHFDLSLTPAAAAAWRTLGDMARSVAGSPAAAGQPDPAGPGSDCPPLGDMAWTLQVGREAMEFRLAILAGSHDTLRQRLENWLQGGASPVPGVLAGNLAEGRSALGALAQEPDLQPMLARWLEQGELERLLGLWVQGVAVDWRLLRRARPGRPCSLPTYPFARQTFWLPAGKTEAAAGPLDSLAPVLTTVLEQRAPGGEALLAEQQRLEQQLAQLMRALLAELDPASVQPVWQAWQQALTGLLQPFSATALARESAWQGWAAYRREAEAQGGPVAQIALVETVLRALPDILAGRRAATAVMFPEGRLELVEAVYKQNAVAVRFNETLARAVLAFVRQRQPAVRPGGLRILEIGAGTGGTTQGVLQALAPWAEAVAEYRYTDVSRAFLIQGERRFKAQAPFLQTALFDLEQPLQGQAVEAGAYDLVIAANVLHATRSMATTLARVSSLLAPGGLLLVNETSAATLFTHLTFGLLEGWWRFTDPECRIPGTPSLSTASWRKLVEDCGLEWLGASPAAEQELGQQVWAARRPGQGGNEPRRALPAATGLLTADRLLLAPAPVAAAQVAAAPGEGSLRGVVLQALATTLNLEVAAIDPQLSFADYGLDSILGAELVHRLRESLGVELRHPDLFDYPTVPKLVAHLASLGAQVASLPGNGPDGPAREVVAEPPCIASPAPSGGREPIAIVGYSGRFAASADPESLWQHLRAGDDLVQEVSRFKLNAQDGDCRHGSFIDGVDRFDARFFNISGLEATYMDPQQRLFLEEAWRTLEHAGHAGADMTGRRCGVFVGCAHGDYQELFQEQPPGQAFWGNTCSLIPARIAYYLDLKGPAVAVDTACSSSLVAVHLACHSIWQGESDMALAGGVFIQSSPRFYLYANQARMLSPSGRCAAFGAGADGIVPGEAVGAVLLRPLSQALADGDTIHGLIVATGINQDGATNGITAPSALSQEQLLREVYQQYGIDPARIQLVEAHGTGTPLGDPIEHAALSRAFRGWTEARNYCALGSVKSNLGHATTAAGITGLIKVLLALKHREIPPTLHAEPPNPALALADSPFYLNDRPVPWQAPGNEPRQAAISSFGFGGTNAHVVLREAPGQTRCAPRRPACLFVLSAGSVDGLRQRARALATELAASRAASALTPGDVAYTLALGRRHGDCRLAVLADDLAELAGRLESWLAGASESGVATAEGVPAMAEVSSPNPGDAVPAAEDEARYRAWLAEQARAYLAGDTEAAARPFAGQPGRRLPLPTTQFQGRSYWVGAPRGYGGEPTALAAQAAGTGSSRRVAVPEPQPLALQSVRLAPATAWVEPGPSPAWQAVTLAKLAQEGGATAGGSLTRGAVEQGVLRLELQGSLDRSLVQRLAEELAAAARMPDIHAVLLLGDWSGEGAGEEEAGPAAPLACPLPVIAAVPAAAGTGLCLAAHCDFLVLADSGQYRLDTVADAATLALLRRRFGSAVLARLQAGESLAARELADGVAVVPAASLEAAARELARQVAAAPRLALLELKRHMRSGPQAPADLPTPPLGAAQLAEVSDLEAGDAGRSTGQSLQLASSLVSLEQYEDGVVLLRMLEREHKNCFTPALMEGLQEAFARLAADPACKVLVLAGHGPYFACGGTRAGLESLQRGESHFTDQKIYSLPLDFPLPVIAAMQGHAIGAGWSLGMFCDLALFSADSVYHSNYLQFGFTPGAGATLVFPQRLGDDLGREVLFSAREWKGRELQARRADLPVYPAAQVLPRALAVAHRLARQSRSALLEAKKEAGAGLRQPLEAVLARELAMHQTTFIGNAQVLERIRQHFGNVPEPAPVPVPTPAPGETLAPMEKPVPRPDELRAILIHTLAEELLLAPEEIRDGSGFLALGLDSILAVTWVRKLNARLGLELPATIVYAHPTVGALLQEIQSRQPAPRERAGEPAPGGVVPQSPAQASTLAPAPAEADRRQALRRVLVETLAEELLLAPEDIQDSSAFLNLGLDSILAVTWVRKLNARLGLELSATIVYAQPSVGQLLAEILQRLPASPAAPQPEAVPVTAPPEPVPAVLPCLSKPADPLPAPVADTAIAIIGAAGRFPRADDLAAFWENIRQGRDCIDEVPPSRWSLADCYDPDPQAPGKSYSKWMGVIGDIDCFDAAFFNITAREAELMDPQQRLFLEQAWLALEDAALDPARLAGSRCGIFVGSGASGYSDLIHETNAYSLIGSAGSILAARLSYLLDLRGPAVALDTACSTSLVAIAEACDSLCLGNSDLALAGGACVLLGPRMHVDTCKVGMLSPDGRCHSFDQRANGFVPGEGVGVVVLKRLADAERDGDPIRAVIRGWGVNQDGRTNGITAPNPLAQGDLLRGVYERFAIAPASIGLVEAHGTGTPLGDPIEIEGLRAGFGDLDPARRIALGSVKSNVGHLLAAAGVAGALKAMLALEHAELPPSLHFQQQNEHLNLAGSPFQIQTRLEPWPSAAGANRRAAVSAFGFSGTNAHLVLEAYPARVTSPSGEQPLLVTLSARSQERLAALAERLQQYLTAHPETPLADFCWTLQQGRRAFECRAAFVCQGREALLARLAALAAGRQEADTWLSQGGQGRELLDPADAETRALLDKWLAAGRLERLARVWVQGVDLDWRQLPGASARRRLRLPGYPFARDRHWIAGAPATSPAPARASWWRAEAGGESLTLRGDEADLGLALVAGEAYLSGWAYPSLVAALQGQPAGLFQLTHLVWGRPHALSAGPLELQLRSDGAGPGGLFRLLTPAGQVRLVGEWLKDAAPIWPEPPESSACQLDTAAFRRAQPLARGIVDAWQGGGVWRGRWSRPAGSPVGEGLDPLLLEAVGQLAAWAEQTQGLPGPRFPLALARLDSNGQCPEAGWIWVWSQAGAEGLRVLVQDQAGQPCLMLEGWQGERLEDFAELQ